MRKQILMSVAVVVMLAGCASSKPHEKATSKVAVDPEEAAIGNQIHREILSSFYPYTEPKVVSYVNRVGESLAEHTERRDLSYRFTILYNEKIYATSAPGGYVYVTTGMLYFLQSEAELAAVLAHELGELQYRDPKLSEGRKILDTITRGGMAVGPAFGGIGALAALGLVAVNMATERHDLTPEKRLGAADKRALHYMIESGYDPQGMFDLFAQFSNASKELAPYFYDYYQSRPFNTDRYQDLQKFFNQSALEGKSLTTNRQAYEETMKGLREMYKG